MNEKYSPIQFDYCPILGLKWFEIRKPIPKRNVNPFIKNKNGSRK